MVDLKKSNAPLTTITRDIRQIDAKTGNIYEAIMIIAARATQIGVDLKKELNEKLDEFAANAENLEEVFENKEQIEFPVFMKNSPNLRPSLSRNGWTTVFISVTQEKVPRIKRLFLKKNKKVVAAV